MNDNDRSSRALNTDDDITVVGSSPGPSSLSSTPPVDTPSATIPSQWMAQLRMLRATEWQVANSGQAFNDWVDTKQADWRAPLRAPGAQRDALANAQSLIDLQRQTSNAILTNGLQTFRRQIGDAKGVLTEAMEAVTAAQKDINKFISDELDPHKNSNVNSTDAALLNTLRQNADLAKLDLGNHMTQLEGLMASHFNGDNTLAYKRDDLAAEWRNKIDRNVTAMEKVHGDLSRQSQSEAGLSDQGLDELNVLHIGAVRHSNSQLERLELKGRQLRTEIDHVKNTAENAQQLATMMARHDIPQWKAQIAQSGLGLAMFSNMDFTFTDMDSRPSSPQVQNPASIHSVLRSQLTLGQRSFLNSNENRDNFQLIELDDRVIPQDTGNLRGRLLHFETGTDETHHLLVAPETQGQIATMDNREGDALRTQIYHITSDDVAQSIGRLRNGVGGVVNVRLDQQRYAGNHRQQLSPAHEQSLSQAGQSQARPSSSRSGMGSR